MGCCCSSQAKDAAGSSVAEYSNGKATAGPSSRKRASSLVEPSRVSNLFATSHTSLPHIILKWEPPSNLAELDGQIVDKYCIKITGSYEGSGEPEPPMEVEVEGVVTSRELTSQDGLKPLVGYRFDVQAIRHHKKGAWASVECYVDWVCRLPLCKASRQKLPNGDIYPFCSVGHKIEYDEGFCQHPDCSTPLPPAPQPSSSSSSGQVKSRTPSESSAPPLVREKEHFCSKEDYQNMVAAKNCVFLIQVESDTQEYREIEANLQKQWNSKTISCPSLKLILAVINPRQETNFSEYKKMYNIKDKNISSYFLATDTGCDLYSNQIPCKNASNFSNCKMCHLSSNGLGKLIYPDCPSFSMQKNPADAHLKAKPDSEMHIYSLFLCDVACNNAKKVKSSSDERPEGVDVVLVQQTDEVKVFNADMVCIRYILFYIV